MLSKKEIRRKAIPVLKKHGVLRAAIFGSYATARAGGESDIDILVELEENIGLMDFVGIKLDLEEALGISVDLVEYQAIKPALKEDILKEAVTIYDSEEKKAEGLH